MKVIETGLSKISLDELAQRIDSGDVDAKEASKLLEFVDGLSATQRGHLTLSRLEEIDLAPKFKDLAVLGLILEGAPKITPETMGANLRETFEKMPRLRLVLEKNLQSKKGESPPPRHDFRYAATRIKERRLRERNPFDRAPLGIGENDQPSGFTLNEDNGTYSATVRFNKFPKTPSDELSQLVQHRRALNGSPPVATGSYEVPLSAIDTASLLSLLEHLPTTGGLQGAVKGLFSVIGDKRGGHLRALIQTEVDKRNRDSGWTANALRNAVASIKNDRNVEGDT